jgi:hypothetical protein
MYEVPYETSVQTREFIKQKNKCLIKGINFVMDGKKTVIEMAKVLGYKPNYRIAEQLGWYLSCSKKYLAEKEKKASPILFERPKNVNYSPLEREMYKNLMSGCDIMCTIFSSDQLGYLYNKAKTSGKLSQIIKDVMQKSRDKKKLNLLNNKLRQFKIKHNVAWNYLIQKGFNPYETLISMSDKSFLSVKKLLSNKLGTEFITKKEKISLIDERLEKRNLQIYEQQNERKLINKARLLEVQKPKYSVRVQKIFDEINEKREMLKMKGRKIEITVEPVVKKQTTEYVGEPIIASEIPICPRKQAKQVQNQIKEVLEPEEKMTFNVKIKRDNYGMHGKIIRVFDKVTQIGIVAPYHILRRIPSGHTRRGDLVYPNTFKFDEINEDVIVSGIKYKVDKRKIGTDYR